MKQIFKQYAGALLLIPTLLAGSAQAQTPGQGRKAEVQAPPSQEITKATEQDANDTRERLNRLFEQYPPTLRQILRIDPSLMANRDYLAMYPALNEFLTAHPEIGHNPSYFVGQSEYDYRASRDPRQQAIEMWRNVMESVAAFLAIATALGVFTWLIKTLIDYRRWHRVSKVQAEVHSKLMDRFTSNEDLLAYVQTSAGRRFLESAPIPIDTNPRTISAPVGRILWSVQAGLVLAFGGLGLQFAIPADLAENFGAQPLSVISMLAIAIGVGFVISAVVSYVISQRLGLFDQSAVRPGTDGREAPTQP